MASTSKTFKIVCGSVSSLFDTRWHTHNICIFCLGIEHARDVLEWKICVHCELFLWKSSALVCPSFQGKSVSVCFPRFETHRCRGTEAIEIVGFAVGYGRWVREGTAPFRTRRRAGDVWGRGSWDWTLSILLHCIWTSYWRLWIIKINLSGHKSPARASLPFFINLDVKVEKEWKKLFFLVFICFSILVMPTLRGCVKMAMRGCPLCNIW